MIASEWLDELARRIAERDPAIDCSRPEPGSLTLARGARGAIVLERGKEIVVTPTQAGGTTLASRLTDRVTYGDAQPFPCEPSSIDRAFDAIIAHFG
jgi:hypothetical protein